MKKLVYVSKSIANFDEDDGTRRYTVKPKEATSPAKKLAGMGTTIPAYLDDEKDVSGSPYTDEFGGWASVESIEEIDTLSMSILKIDEVEILRAAGFTPYERELVKIDGEIQPSNMVRCGKDGKPVRVRLEPGSDHLTGAHIDDANN